MKRDFEPILRGLADRIRGLIQRARLTRVEPAAGERIQELQVAAGPDVHDRVAHPQPYGFGAVPLPGCEVHVFWPGGSRDAGVALLVADRTDLAELKEGEVVVYNRAAGTKIHLKSSGEIVIDGDVRVTGSLLAEGDVSDGVGSMDEDRQVYNLHTHPHPEGPTGPPTQPMGGGA